MPKISTLGNVIVLFVNDNDIEHKVVYDEWPNIAMLEENFKELSEFISQGINIGNMKVDIMSMENYVNTYGDEEIDESQTRTDN